MKSLVAVLTAVPLLAAVDGTVTNKTTGRPQAGATVALYKLGGTGMEAVAQAKTDAAGKFVIDAAVEGPHLVQSVFDGVTYNHMLPPGSASTGLDLAVYAAQRKQPAGVKIAQHMILFEPGNGQLVINETYIFRNDDKVTWNDPNAGTLKFFLPEEAKGIVQVNATAPQGMPVRRAAEKTGRGDVYKLDFAIKPGETRIDLTYLVPYTGGEYKGRLVMPGEATRLVTPSGVTLKGDNLTALPPEPRTQANIYDLTGSEYRVAIEGSGSLRAQEEAGEGGGEGAESGGPSIDQILPRINSNAKLIVGLALGILALGFVLLYRAQDSSPAARAGESNERRRR